jgi:hypothetical protein
MTARQFSSRGTAERLAARHRFNPMKFATCGIDAAHFISSGTPV